MLERCARQIKTGMDFMNSAFKDMKERMDTVIKKITSARRENQNLREKCEAS